MQGWRLYTRGRVGSQETIFFELLGTLGIASMVRLSIDTIIGRYFPVEHVSSGPTNCGNICLVLPLLL